MAPRAAYWGRTKDDGDKVYCHVRVADCVGTILPAGMCGVCKSKEKKSVFDLAGIPFPGETQSIPCLSLFEAKPKMETIASAAQRKLNVRSTKKQKMDEI